MWKEKGGGEEVDEELYTLLAVACDFGSIGSQYFDDAAHTKSQIGPLAVTVVVGLSVSWRGFARGELSLTLARCISYYQ